MSNDSIKQIIAQLDRKYELITNKAYEVSEKTFFIGVADYVAITSNIPIVHKIIMDSIIVEQRREQEKVNVAEDEAVKELEQTAKKLKNYIKRNNLTNETQHSVDEYERLFAQGYYTSQSPAESRFHKVREIAEAIESLEGKHKKYSAKFLVLSDDGINHRWNLSPAYYNLENIKKRFEHEKEIAIWGSWNELAIAFNAFFRSQEIQDEYFASDNHGRWFEFMNGWGGIIKDKEKVMEKKDEQRLYFKKDNYLHYLWRIHSHLLDQLNMQIQLKKEVQTLNEQPSENEIETVKGLFQITDNPPRVRYVGAKTKDDDWLTLKYKTQAFAILSLVADKYKRNSAVEKVPFIKLSYAEIKERLENKEYCSRVLNWKSAPTPARLLSTAKSNIRKLIPFTDKELSIETKQTSFLVFNIS